MVNGGAVSKDTRAFDIREMSACSDCRPRDDDGAEEAVFTESMAGKEACRFCESC